MPQPNSPDFALSCPLPIVEHATIQLAHGGGGRFMRNLIEGLFRPAFAADGPRSPAHDSAVVPYCFRDRRGGRLAMTTDTFVVRPLFFPGGDIGTLAVYGTVNDLAMSGARPLYLSAGFILEEGLPMDTLRRVVDSMSAASREAGVQIVTGDTKVVDRGKGDGIFINTAGVGLVPPGIDRAERVAPATRCWSAATWAAMAWRSCRSARGWFRERAQSDCASLAGWSRRCRSWGRSALPPRSDPRRPGRGPDEIALDDTWHRAGRGGDPRSGTRRGRLRNIGLRPALRRQRRPLRGLCCTGEVDRSGPGNSCPGIRQPRNRHGSVGSRRPIPSTVQVCQSPWEAGGSSISSPASRCRGFADSGLK